MARAWREAHFLGLAAFSSSAAWQLGDGFRHCLKHDVRTCTMCRTVLSPMAESLPLKPVLKRIEASSSYGDGFFGQNSIMDTGNRTGLFTLFCPRLGKTP